METESISGLPAPIEPVANDGATEAKGMGSVQPQLMGPAGQGRELNQALPQTCFPFLPKGDAQFPLLRVVDLIGAIFRIQPEFQSNLPRISCHLPAEQGQIVLFHLARGKLDRELAMRLSGQTKNHQAGRIHIQAMDSRLLDAAGDHLPNPGCDAVLFLRAAAWHGQQPAGLVDHDQLLILIENIDSLVHDKPQSWKPRIGWHFERQAEYQRPCSLVPELLVRPQ